jgi:hypothetical protein
MELDSISESGKEQAPEDLGLAGDLDFDRATLSRMPLASLLYCILIGDSRVYLRGDRHLQTT